MRQFVNRVLDSRVVVISVLVVASIGVVALSVPASPWWSGLLQNVGAGLFTSLVLIVVYDRILERRSERENATRRAIAMRRLASSLRAHINGVLFDICYGGMLNAPSKPVPQLELVRNIFVPAATKVNILKPVSSHWPTPLAMGRWAAMAFGGFRGSLDFWLASHGTVASTEAVSAVEALMDSNYLRFVRRMDYLVDELEKMEDMQDTAAMGDEASLREYASRLAALTMLVEASVGASLGDISPTEWSREHFPLGHARLSWVAP